MNATNDEHPPEKVPADSLALRAPPRPVTRLNRRVLAVAGALLAGAVLMAMLWALRPPKARETKAPEPPRVTRVPRAEGLAALPADYTQVPKLGPPLGELGRSIMQIEQQADAPPVPDRYSFEHDPEEDAARAARLAQQADADAAAKAGVFFKLSRAEPQPTPETTLAMPSGTDQRAPTQTPPDDPNGQASKLAFLQATQAEQHARVSAAVGSQPTFTLKAGDTIPAALFTRINSDLPGTVTATVTENVYDSDTGKHLLIPQGATLVGRYDSQVTAGQTRVLVVWTKLVMDKAPTIALDQLQATDAGGQAGLHDRVDWHWRRIFAGAALSTVIGVGAELAAPDRRADGDDRVIVAARDSIEDTANEVGKEITRKYLAVQPTLSDRNGLPLRVMVHADVQLPVYRPPSGATHD